MLDLSSFYDLGGYGGSQTFTRHVVMDPDQGLLVEKDGNWRRLTLMGYNLGGSSKESPSVVDLVQQLESDFSAMGAALQGAADRYAQSSAVTSLTQKLSDPAHMILTSADLNAVADAFINEYCVSLLGMETFTFDHSTWLKLGNDTPALIAGTQLEAVWSQVWSMLQSMYPHVRLGQIPQFTLTTNCGDESGIITLSSEPINVTINYQVARYTGIVTFNAVGNVCGSSFTANGTLTRSTFTLEVVGEGWRADGMVALGKAPAFTLTVTDTQNDSIIATLIGSVTGSGITATLTAGYDVYTLDLSGNGSGATLAVTHRYTYDSIFNPRTKLDLSVSNSRLYAEYTDDGVTNTFTLTRNIDNSYDLNITEYNSHMGRTKALSAKLSQTATGYSLTGSSTLGYGALTTFAANLYTGTVARGSDENAKYGFDFTITQGKETNSMAYVLEQTSANSYSLRIASEDYYSKDEVLITLLETPNTLSATLTYNYSSRWSDPVTETYTAVATINGDVLQVNVDLGETDVVLTLTAKDENTLDVDLTTKIDGEE